jgi:RasGEF domain
MLEQLMELASSQSNYINYRNELKARPLPALPYFGVFLKDLTFIEDGNPKYFDKERGIYNFERMRMASTIFASLQHFQVRVRTVRSVCQCACRMGFVCGWCVSCVCVVRVSCIR